MNFTAAGMSIGSVLDIIYTWSAHHLYISIPIIIFIFIIIWRLWGGDNLGGSPF